MPAPGAPPPKHFSTRDYTDDLIAANSVCLAIGTLAIAARIWVRIRTTRTWKAADYLVVVGYCGFLVNIIANYIAALNGAVGITIPTAEELSRVKSAFSSIGIAFPVGVCAAKLSLLFFFRDIFGMRLTWFRVGWWTIFALIFPCWLALSLAFGILGIVSPGVLVGKAQAVGVPVSSFLNAGTDLMMLLLPVRMTLDLKIAWGKRIQVIAIFCLGFAATAVSLARAGRNIVARQENWDLRYQTYSESVIGIFEYAIVVSCACLPVIRPLFKELGLSFRSIKSSFSFSRSMGTTKGSAGSQSTNAYHDDQVPINMDNLGSNVIHRRDEINVESMHSVGRPKSSNNSFQ